MEEYYLNNPEYLKEYETEDWRIVFYEVTDINTFLNAWTEERGLGGKCMSVLNEIDHESFSNKKHNGCCYSNARYHRMWSEITLQGFRKKMDSCIPDCMRQTLSNATKFGLFQKDSEFYNKQTVIEKGLDYNLYRQPYVVVKYPNSGNLKGIYIVKLEKTE